MHNQNNTLSKHTAGMRMESFHAITTKTASAWRSAGRHEVSYVIPALLQMPSPAEKQTTTTGN